MSTLTMFVRKRRLKRAIRSDLRHDLLAIGQRIHREAVKLGYRAAMTHSQRSHSCYVMVCKGCSICGCRYLRGGCKLVIKVRISDHTLPSIYGKAGYDVHSRFKTRPSACGTWVDCLEWLADEIGEPHPRICKIARTKERK